MSENKPPEEERHEGVEKPRPGGTPAGAHAAPAEPKPEPPAEAGAQAEVKAEAREPEAGAGPQEPKRLYRSRTNRIIAGVAGGLGEYFGIDPTIVRILWVLLVLAGGVGIVAYIAAWVVIPERPEGERAEAAPAPISNEVALLIGLVLVGVGLWFLLRNLGLIPGPLFAFFEFFREAFWPLMLIILGVIIILAARQARGGISISTGGKILRRSRKSRMLAGVAGGLGEYFGIDPTFIRLAWVALGLINPVAAIIVYIVMAIVIPEEPINTTA